MRSSLIAANKILDLIESGVRPSSDAIARIIREETDLPELLEALEDTLVKNGYNKGCVHGCLFHANKGNEHARWCVSVRTAITKAEGRKT